jgi:hypothetical protein
MWKEAVMAYLKHHSGTFLGGLMKITKPSSVRKSQVSWLRFKLGISKIKAINVTSRANFLDTLEIYAALVNFFFLYNVK